MNIYKGLRVFLNIQFNPTQYSQIEEICIFIPTIIEFFQNNERHGGSANSSHSEHKEQLDFVLVLFHTFDATNLLKVKVSNLQN